MKRQTRIRISFDFILAKLFCLAAIGFFTVSIVRIYLGYEQSSNNLTQYWITILALTGVLIYISSLPVIHYDKRCVYIKRLAKKKITVPLKNIKSIHSYGKQYRGIASFGIKYTNSSGQVEIIKFRARYSSQSALAFMDTLTITASDSDN